MSAIFERASVRCFTGEDVSDEEILELLRAAMAAPSAGNQQPWSFDIVRDEAIRQALSHASPYARMIPKAPVAIVVYMAPDGLCKFPAFKQQDVAAAVENLLLRATELGLGAVWVGIAPMRERMDVVSAAIAGPEGFEPFCIVSVGRPNCVVVPKGAKRFDESHVRWV